MEFAVFLLIVLAFTCAGFGIGFVLGKDRRFMLAFNLGWEAGVRFALKHPDVAAKSRGL